MVTRTLKTRGGPLATELATFNDRRRELLAKAPGKYVLIKNREVIGVFDSQLEAVREGTELYLTAPFLVAHIVAVDVPIVVPTSWAA